MSRTKAEALANPQAGDMWRKKSSGVVFETRMVKEFGVVGMGLRVIFYEVWRKPETCASAWAFQRNFLRWAKDAEFMGGSDE